MNDNFNYYLIIENNKGKTPLLENDDEIDEEGIEYLYSSTKVPEDHLTHICFLQKMRKPDMNTDYLTLETFNVFSKKVAEALQQHMPINGLQLVRASIEEGEYTDFYIANIYQRLFSFDKEMSIYEGIYEKIGWNDITKIVLDKKILSNIALENRLVYISKENSRFKLYHQSIVDIIKSVDPIGMKFIPIEEWHEGSLFDSMR